MRIRIKNVTECLPREFNSIKFFRYKIEIERFCLLPLLDSLRKLSFKVTVCLFCPLLGLSWTESSNSSIVSAAKVHGEFLFLLLIAWTFCVFLYSYYRRRCTLNQQWRVSATTSRLVYSLQDYTQISFT